MKDSFLANMVDFISLLSYWKREMLHFGRILALIKKDVFIRKIKS